MNNWEKLADDDDLDAVQRQSIRLHTTILTALLILTILFCAWQHTRIDDLEDELTLLKADYKSHGHPHYHY